MPHKLYVIKNAMWSGLGELYGKQTLLRLFKQEELKGTHILSRDIDEWKEQ